MALRCLTAIFLGLMLFTPSTVLAEPRCGDVDGGLVDDVWDLADDIRFYRDHREPIRNVCKAMEALEDYQRNNTLSDDEEDILDDQADILVETVERQLKGLEKNLKAAEVWLRADTDSDRERLRRYVNIKEAREHAVEAIGDLERSRLKARALIKP